MKELVESPRAVSLRTDDTPAGGKMRLTRQLLTPYRGWIVIILLAMLVETAMSLAAPWPLKVILDNVVGTHKAPEWLDAVRSSLLGENKMALAAVAGIATVLIAALGAVASYIDNYYTESVGQWVAHDLRMRVYDHLQHLSLGFYDTHQTGALLSTITDDIKTIQNFASSSTLDILVDLLTILGMLAQTAVAMERVQTILDTQALVPENADGREPGALTGAITFDHVAFGRG
jgi:ABC-type multidrug transport system fused ATPase/permease subunit